MRPNRLVPWEPRIGKLRVYYDIQNDPEPVVHARAVGVKDHNELRIGGRIFPL
jgi:hypothetical protein